MTFSFQDRSHTLVRGRIDGRDATVVFPEAHEYFFRGGIVTKVVGVFAKIDRLFQCVGSAVKDPHFSVRGVGNVEFVKAWNV
jgi:hypothetical protein